MNHKLVESYVKDRLRKLYGRNVFSENGIAYIGAEIEIDFLDKIYVFGYKTSTSVELAYPSKDGYAENVLESIISVIDAIYTLESAYDFYKEVI